MLASRLVLEEIGVRAQMRGFGQLPNNPIGTDAMNEFNNKNSVKLLLAICKPSLVAKLIPLLWRLVVAVRCFFRRKDLAELHGPT